MLQVSSSQQQISASLLNVVANYATTGSNSFRADQSITGSLTVTGSSTFIGNLTIQSGSITLSSGSINSYGTTIFDGVVSGSVASNNPSMSLVIVSGSFYASSSRTTAVYIAPYLTATGSAQILEAVNINPRFSGSTTAKVALRISTGNLVIGSNNDGGSRALYVGGIIESNASVLAPSISANSIGIYTGTSVSIQGPSLYLSGSNISMTGSVNITGSLNVSQGITGSSILSTGTITAQTLVVQTITSSIEYSSGSNIFGSQLSNTQTFTGSFYQTGSVAYFAGNVGVGQINPSYALDVANSSSPSLRVRNGALGGTATLLLETANDFSGTCQTYVKCIGTTSNGTSILTFGTAGASGDVTATERMRITGGGNVGIGNTSPGTKLVVNNAISGAILPYINATSLSYNSDGISVAGSNTANANIGNGLTLYNNVASVGAYSPVIAFSSMTSGGAYNATYAFITGIYQGAGGDTNWAIGDLMFGTGNSYGATERMRITSAGLVSIGPATGTSNVPGVGRLSVIGAANIGENTNGTANIDAYGSYAYYGCNGSTYAIWIGPSGLVYNYSNSTTFNTTSDIRVKENVVTIPNALDKIAALNPVTFDYKQDFATHRSWNDTQKNNNIGFIAQEFETVFPKYVHSSEETINEEVVEDFKTIDTGHLVPYLVKAIQELKAENDSLKSRVEALETN